MFTIFQSFEVQRKISLAPLFNRWSSSKEVTCSSALEALLSLDAVKVFRTTLHFPKWRKLSANAVHSSSRHDTQLYDPIFLMLLIHIVLSEHQPATPFGWIELLRTNVVGLCVQSLSSKDKLVRELGLSLVASFSQSIEVSGLFYRLFFIAEVSSGAGISRAGPRFIYPQSSQGSQFTPPCR